MAKDKSGAKLSKDEKRALKAEKKAKSQPPEDAGVVKVKSEKKDKKEKKHLEALAERAINEIQNESTAAVEAEADSQDEGMEVDDDVVVKEEKSKAKAAGAKPIGALVPFANPLADDKVGKKVFKGVKKAAAQRTLKRGVKEVVKALRKSPTSLPSSSSDSSALPIGIVVLAADISPMDVISHIPVLCEDHNIPYIYVTSRAELGMAGMTKRPTSVVMVSRDAGKKGVEKTTTSKDGGKKKGAAADETDGEDWSETYKGLVKVVEREGRHVKI